MLREKLAGQGSGLQILGYFQELIMSSVLVSSHI